MIQATAATGEQTLIQGSQPNELGSDAFLNLLIQQMKNQDPLEPMKGTEFVTQLAQFNELDEIRKVVEGQESMKDYLMTTNHFSSLSLLGKEIEFSGQQVAFEEGVPTDVPFRLANEASKATVTIYDMQGTCVRQLNSGKLDAGLQQVGWDGKDDNGQQLTSGMYRFEVNAEDAHGNMVPVESYQKGNVEKVEFQQGQPILCVDGQWITLAEILSIHDSKDP
jgi:flagellar basal-body rod modification protein FlgD